MESDVRIDSTTLADFVERLGRIEDKLGILLAKKWPNYTAPIPVAPQFGIIVPGKLVLKPEENK